MKITDEQLDKRADDLVALHYPVYPKSARSQLITGGMMNGYRKATRAALEVDRESLRLLEEAHSLYRENGYSGEENFLAHITTLKKRLGIEP